MLTIRFGNDKVQVIHDGNVYVNVEAGYEDVRVEVQRCAGPWYALPRILQVIRGGAHLMAAMVDLQPSEGTKGNED